MSNHISDELPRLLTGDANREAVLAAAEHLRSCPDCQQDLVSAVVAHAALTSAHRFAPEIVAPGSEPGGEPVGEVEPTGPLPDLTSVFAQAHQDAAKPPAPAHNRRRLIAVAAAAAVIVGGGATVTAVELGSSGSSARSVALKPYVRGQAPTASARANVVIDNSRVRVDASKLPSLDSRHVYELWVTNEDRTKMQAVGTFANTKAEMTVDHKVLSQYNDFEVSVQKINDTQYSGISVARGQYG
jgi:Anti-sigma-K factor rskA